MICTVATAWSFDRSAAKLKTLCSINVSDDTIERVCQHQGEKARHWLRGATETVERFDTASGDPEFYSDGLKINTTDGWREMRLNLVQKTGACDASDTGSVEAAGAAGAERATGLLPASPTVD